MFKKFYESMKMKYVAYLNNEKGAQALEWIALGLLAIAVMSGIITFVKNDDSIGKAVSNVLSNLINSLGGGGE